MPTDAAEVKDLVTGVILAGGLARRMDRKDKGLININTKPLIKYVIDGMIPQVSTLLINANRNIEEYGKFGYPVIADKYPDFRGPLAGMYSCIPEVKTGFMLTVPCDSPFVPPDIAVRLYKKLKQKRADISVASNAPDRRTAPARARSDA